MLSTAGPLAEPDIRFKTLMESAPDAIVIVDQFGTIVYVNGKTVQLFGYAEASALVGQHVEILMPLSLRGSRRSPGDSLIASATQDIRGHVELCGLRKDGSEVSLEVSMNLLETSQGVLIPIAIRSVAHRTNADVRLRQSDEQLRFILDSMPQKIATTTPNGDVDYFNPQCSEFSGLPFKKLRGWGWTQFIHSDDVDEHVRVWKQSIITGDAFEFESRFRRHDGAYRWHFSRALPMRNQAGEVVMWVGSNTDIHDMKEAETALHVSEVRYRRLFEAAKDGILIVDFETGMIVDSNPFMTGLLGYSHTEFQGRQLWEIGLFSDRSASEAAVRSLQDDGYLRYEHLPLEASDGRLVEVEIVANAYREGIHQVIQFNVRDITERSRLEKLLHAQAAELSDLHQRKDEFLAMLSHELRSPLAPIANAVQLLSLQQGTESRIQQQSRNIIERQLGKLEHLVDDLLEVSRITSGRVQLRQEWVSICGIAEGAVETVRPLMEQRRHELSLSLPMQPIWLYGDPARLEQVITNLLTNAAKYTEERGCIWLSVQRDREECVIRVRDTGVGISTALLPHVFELFTQAERSLDRSQGGLGIGLALVQRLTELHGGTVEAQSQPGKGSEFIVRLPLRPEGSLPAPPIADTGNQSARSLRVLVVDDNADTVLGFSMLLKSSGHDVRTAHNGLTAVQAAAEFRPHAVLLDIGLPGLNGYEAAKQMRKQPQGKDIVLIALTGYGQDSDRQASKDAGFNHHIVKPARFDHLLEILATVDERLI